MITVPDAVAGALVVAIFTHGGIMLRWTGVITSTVASHHERIKRLEDRGSSVAIETAAKLETHMQNTGTQPRRRRTDSCEHDD